MIRIAQCCCGSLRTEVSGEPAFVGACHCIECQGRPGSPFGVSTIFPKARVRTEGPNKVYVRGSDSGRKIELHFCPDCGFTMFWYAEFVANLIGIAFGTFVDPTIPWPTVSVLETTGNSWVIFDRALDRFERQVELIEGPIAARR